MDKVAFLEFALDVSAGCGSFFCDGTRNRANIYEFMERNDWFGAEHVYECRRWFVASGDIEKFKNPLTLWLAAYRQPGSVKLALMLREYEHVYPLTCELYEIFIAGKDTDGNHGYWKLLDFLLSELRKEITGYSEAELSELAGHIDGEVTLKAAYVFSEFVDSVRVNGEALSRWKYSYGERDCPEFVNTAYALNEFAVMAYCIFNEANWQEQDMVSKAVRSPQYADLWLSVALRFICALRTADLRKLPAPKLSCDASELRSRITDGAFTVADARLICDEFTKRTEAAALQPSKTRKHREIPTIKLSVPERLKEPLGIIIAIALIHYAGHESNTPFVRAEKPRSKDIHDFFGEHFAKALGNRDYSPRRCNKSYLQGIEAIAGTENAPGKPKGYMLAALARSHKSGIGGIASMTDVYLRDANFTGYSPEFIAHEMFERGVLSFIPAILLELYAGNDYKRLSVSAQTKLITALGLTAPQIERIAMVVTAAIERSRDTVRSLFTGAERLKEKVHFALQNIASGNAPSRHSEYLCLMTATFGRCNHGDRESCIGCGYEIYTQSAMHTLMKEYVRLITAGRDAGIFESKRSAAILETAIFPAIAEVLTASKMLYGDENAAILGIMEDNLNYVALES